MLLNADQLLALVFWSAILEQLDGMQDKSWVACLTKQIVARVGALDGPSSFINLWLPMGCHFACDCFTATQAGCSCTD